MYAITLLVCVLLSPASKRVRLNYCTRSVLRSQLNWAQLLLTGEYKYSLNTDSRSVVIKREGRKRSLN